MTILITAGGIACFIIIALIIIIGVGAVSSERYDGSDKLFKGFITQVKK